MGEPLAIGDLVERYRVDEVLGKGGMAVVYGVTHVQLETAHALKVLLDESPEVRERMLGEGKLQATLDHPNILAVRDVLDVNGAPGLLMDRVFGGSLSDLLARGITAPEEAIRIFDGILEGVGWAHERGMVHRDLKPGNILLCNKGKELVPKIADFGLAKILRGEDQREHKTLEGSAMGTPSYMAPEQIFDAARADQRADIWALGVILYELSTGQLPFQGSAPMHILYNVSNGEYQDPRSLRPHLSDAIHQSIRGCLIPNPESRLPSVEVLRAILRQEQALDPSVTATPYVSLGQQPAPSLSANTFLLDSLEPSELEAPAVDRSPSSGIDDNLAVDPPLPVASSPLAPTHRIAASRRPWWRLGLFLIPALIAYSDLTGAVDAWLQYPLIEKLRGPLPSNDVVVVTFEGMRDPRMLRPDHPAVIESLVDQGATAILIDLALLSESDHDGAIATAIRAAESRGVPVILPVFTDERVARLPESSALRETPSFGIIEFQRELLGGTVVRAPVYRRTLDGETWWHATVLATHAHLDAKRPATLDGSDLVVGATHNPTWAGLVWLHPVEDVPRVAYEKPETWGEQVRGRVAVIGTYGGAADLHLTPQGPRYGVEIHAALIQTLLRQAGLRVLPLWANALVALLTGLSTALLALWLPHRQRFAAALIPMSILAIGGSLLYAATLVALTPIVIAGVLVPFAVAPLLRSTE